jgi:hypothetical protein
MGESLWWLSNEERSAEERKARLGGAALPAALARTFEPPVFLLLGLDLRGADSIGARVGYNLATGLSDRGLTYLRFGPPDGRALGGKNSINPECNTTELEYWDYDRYGTLRFSKPVAFSEGLRTLPEVVFRPMEYEQFELTKQVLVEDHTAVPAPLEFGVWTAELRSPEHPPLSDLVVVSTRGRLAASLVSPTGGERERRQSGAGVVSLQGEAGGFTLLAHARLGDELGRQRLDIVLRGFDSLPTMSDLLIGEVWASPLLDRRSMLGHLRRDLVFASGDTVRTYVELYGLADDARSVWYRVTYSLLKSGNIMEDYAKDDWPDAQRFEFERHEPAQASGATIETLDILPQWIPEGRYLLRLEVEDLAGQALVGRSTIAFEVKD